MTNHDYDVLEAEAKRVSLREQKATVMEIILAIEDAAVGGKIEYTADEVIDFLYMFVRNGIEL